MHFRIKMSGWERELFILRTERELIFFVCWDEK